MKQPKLNYFSKQSGADLTRLPRDKRCFLKKKLFVTDVAATFWLWVFCFSLHSVVLFVCLSVCLGGEV